MQASSRHSVVPLAAKAGVARPALLTSCAAPPRIYGLFQDERLHVRRLGALPKVQPGAWRWALLARGSAVASSSSVMSAQPGSVGRPGTPVVVRAMASHPLSHPAAPVSAEQWQAHTADRAAAPRTLSPASHVVPQPGRRRALQCVAQATYRHGVKISLKRAKLPQKTPPPSPLESSLASAPFIASDEQRRAIDAVLTGRNLFLTGCAGTGKSATLLELRRQLQAKYGSQEEYERRVGVVAMTGLAATIVGGVTLHSLLKLGRLETYRDFERLVNNEELLSQLLALRTLILDEAGMMSAELLQALDHYLTLARREAVEKVGVFKSKAARQKFLELFDRPFGGLQLILSGDFFQLAPIPNKIDAHATRPGAPQRSSSAQQPRDQPFLNRGFMFQAPVFHYGGFEVVELKQVFRQEDAAFVGLLDSVRCGEQLECDRALDTLIATCSSALDESDGIKATRLYSKNKSVGERNEQELAKLPGKTEEFKAYDTARVTHEPPVSVYAPLVREGLLGEDKLDALGHEMEATQEALREETLKALVGHGAAPRALELRAAWWREAHAHLKTVAEGGGGLFRECQAAEKIQLKEGAQVMLVRNVDLGANLANGSRGVVVGFADMDEEDRRKCKAMALSLDVSDCDADMVRWMRKNSQVPLVKFTNGEVTKVLPAIFTAQVPGYGFCIRAQVPLKLAWALTVHKSQGMTLDRVVIDLNDFFGHGMLYTALSRARSTQGMQLMGKSYRKMDPWVMKWWREHRTGRRYIDQSLPLHSNVPWCWRDGRQPITGQPQNPQAVKWFDEGSDAFFAWHEAQRLMEAEHRRQEEARRREEERRQEASKDGHLAVSLPQSASTGPVPEPAPEVPTAQQQDAASTYTIAASSSAQTAAVAPLGETPVEPSSSSPFSAQQQQGGQARGEAAAQRRLVSGLVAVQAQLRHLSSRSGPVRKAELQGPVEELEQLKQEVEGWERLRQEVLLEKRERVGREEREQLRQELLLELQQQQEQQLQGSQQQQGDVVAGAV